jgi:hypothetical protein
MLQQRSSRTCDGLGVVAALSIACARAEKVIGAAAPLDKFPAAP